jgi:hypothetical protein
MTFERDPRVDAYIDALPQWQQRVCSRVRELVHSADPEVRETIKRTVQPYFVLDGNICALLAAKDHVNVFLYDGGIVPDPDRIITGGHDNKTARTVAVGNRRNHRRTRAEAHVRADHRQQPRGWLAQAQGAAVTLRSVAASGPDQQRWPAGWEGRTVTTLCRCGTVS